MGGVGDVAGERGDRECIDCDACVEACPVDAITPEDQVPAEWQKYIQINADYYKRQS